MSVTIAFPSDDHPCFGFLAHPFICKVCRLVRTHLDNPDLDVPFLCKHLATSRTPLHNKLTRFTGMSTTEFVRFIRLEEAKKLLLETELAVSEVAYQVGFRSPAYFARRFHERYGMSPTEYRNNSQ